MDTVVYDEITTQVGKKTDVANAAGSAHAKLTDIKTYLSGTIHPYLPKIYQWSATNPLYVTAQYSHSSTTTIVTVSGAGFLCGINILYIPLDGMKLYIYIDGVLIHNGDQPYKNPTVPMGLSFMYRFNSSLTIQASGDGSNGGYVSVAYFLD